jgi:peptide-methionine (S)-S-oxide reductase
MRSARVRLAFVYSTFCLLALDPFGSTARAASISPLDTGLAGSAAMSNLAPAIANPILDLIRAKGAGSLAIAESDTAYFAGGSFWALEANFEAQRGVTRVTSGYSGGRTEAPTRAQVATGRTGHSETVEVVFDPRIVTYETLLDVYWHNVDPTQAGGQLCDEGPQYRSVVFYRNASQRDATLASMKKLTERHALRGAIVTELVSAGAFYRAAAEDQDVHRRQRALFRDYMQSCDRADRLAAAWSESPPAVSTADER